MTVPQETCAPVLAQIQAFVDGDLDAGACARIERHCAQCSSCAALVRGLRQTIGLCRDVGRAPLPDQVSRRAREQVKRLLAATRQRG